MNKVVSLRDMLEQQVQGLFNAEKLTLSELRNMKQRVSSPALRNVIGWQMNECELHIIRLEMVFRYLRITPSNEIPEGVKGLVHEANMLAAVCTDPQVLDAGLIRSLQYIHHYKIVGYGTAAAYAGTLEEWDVQGLMQESVEGEKELDRELSKLAIEQVNRSAHLPI